ncbi:MAG: hypothetical protein M5U26_11225 [Planctomycetota bacterium]|nr:hypothetical protein [Planctomycetota bacterium]
MPIRFEVDAGRKLVRATAHGVLTGAEIFEYQRTVWARPEVAGFNELVDMTGVTSVEQPTPGKTDHLAGLSAEMDAGGPSRFAIVASQDLYYGLGRMYGAYREARQGSLKEVRVFRSRGEALAWLGVEEAGAAEAT